MSQHNYWNKILGIGCLILLFLNFFTIAAGAAIVGSVAGSFSREGTPAGSRTPEDISGGEIVSGDCGEMINKAISYVGVAQYVYGGYCTQCNPPQFDCSSFTMHLYKIVGYSLPRVSAYQADHGTAVSPENLQPGDLVFRRGSIPHAYNDIGHVGMYIGGGRVVHAKGREYGVVIEPVTVFTHNPGYRGARHIVDCE